MSAPCPKCEPGDPSCPFDMSPRPGDIACLEQGFINALHIGEVRAAVEILEGLATIDHDRATVLYNESMDAVTIVDAARRLGIVL